MFPEPVGQQLVDVVAAPAAHGARLVVLFVVLPAVLDLLMDPLVGEAGQEPTASSAAQNQTYIIFYIF